MAIETKEEQLIHSKNKVPNTDINKRYYDLFLDFVSKDHVTLSLKNVSNIFYKIYTCIFANRSINEISAENIYEYIKENPKKRFWTFKFIFFLIDSGVDMHYSLVETSYFREYLYEAKYVDVVLKFLKNPKKNQYIVRNYDGPQLCFLDISDNTLFEITKEFLLKDSSSSHGSAEYKVFAEEFSNSCGKIPTLENLDYDTCLQQIDYFKKYNNKNYYYILNSFYYFVGTNYKPDIFKNKGLQMMNLQKHGFISLIADGYEPINYNPIENVPSYDKWFFIHNNKNVSNMSINRSGSIVADFTRINNETYRSWVKSFIWHNASSKNISHSIYHLSKFCNYISDLKEGKLLSIYAMPTKDLIISANEIMAFKNFMQSQELNIKTQNSSIVLVKKFIKFLTDNNIVPFSASVNYYLSNNIAPEKTNNAKVIPDEDLKRIASVLNEKAQENDINNLCSLIFYIALETEFRISQILTLPTDCVKETNKPNEYVLVSKTKTSAGEEVEQPITIYVKRHIEEALKITQKYRENCQTAELKNHLFLVQALTHKSEIYQLIDIHYFNNYLKKCCKESGVNVYTASNLRDTHMTKAEEFVIRNQMSDMQQNILSGHKSPTTDNKYYIDTNIKTLLESVHGIIIGDVDINGQILTTNADIINPENEVSNGCGYCGRSSCNDFSMLDCMMCKSFVTTPDRLPYFQEQVKLLDYKIQNATIPHDKEDLVNIKRLYLGFINEILKLKEGEYDVN